MPSIETDTTLVRKAELEPVNILLVDDESRNLDALESVLESMKGLRLFRALRAEDALMALLHDEFACIVLDIQMPGMSGLELARHIKARKRNQHIPIIFLTAFFLDEKDVITGYGVGAVDYLTKPINPEILKSKVGAFADLFRTARALATANAALETEITQRKKAEEALRQMNNTLEAAVRERTSELRASQERYEQVVRNLPMAVYTTDAEGKITLFNAAAAELWGQYPKIGQDAWGSCKIYRPDGTVLPMDEGPMALTLKTGEPVRGQEIIIERSDGVRRNILPYPTPIQDPSGKITGAVNLLLDVTERNLAHLVTQRFAAIVESSDDAIVGKDTDGIINSWNQGAERIFHYKASEIIGKSIMTLIPPDRLAEELDILKRIRSGEQVKHFETVRKRKDGSLIDVSLTISPVKNASGIVVGASKIARDISERKRNERQQHALFALVARVNSAPSLSEICDAALETIFQCQDADRAAVLLTDSQGMMMRFKAWRGLSDEYRQAVEGHSPWKPGDTPQSFAIENLAHADLSDELKTVIEKEGIHSLAFIPITFEKRLLGKLMLYFDAPHTFDEDELKPAQTIASQIAFAIEREFVSQQLKRANDELLAASRAKDDFMATLSHELRTPLNPVLLLASDAMNNRDLPPRVRADFNTIRKNIEMEARLIDDLLDLTRIARGKIILEKHFVNLRTVLTDAVAQVREEMNQKRLRLELRLKAMQHTVFADSVRLQQIFWNLLKNAVKFTPEGGQVTIETELAGDTLLTRISDTGIGMTADELAGIFKAFAQGEHAVVNGHRFGGLGLGLSISQKLTELHSGRIIASSDGRDKGSTFTVELPLVTAAEANGQATPSPGFEDTHHGRRAKNIRILLVEDHEPTRTTLASLLARRSYDVVSAGTVEEARNLAREGKFDLLITDIGLPDGNGYDLMNELVRGNPLRGIALTGYGMEHDVTRSENAGFDAHLTKPVRIQSLEAALDATAKLIEKD